MTKESLYESVQSEGDTNFPNISWQSINVVPGIRSDNENGSAKMFLSFLETNGMVH